MVPLRDVPPVDLQGKSVLIVSGQFDPIIPPENSAKLAAVLKGAGAGVVHQVLPTGHQLSQADLTLGRRWAVEGWTLRQDVVAST